VTGRKRKKFSYIRDQWLTFGVVLVAMPFVMVAAAITGWLPGARLPNDFILTLPFALVGMLIVWWMKRREAT
jgi:hypothetical protein